jgi:anti-sigma B factor antagonist
MEQTFDVVEHWREGVLVLAVSGDVDVATAPSLRDRLLAGVAGGGPKIVVDLLGVSFLDSTGLGVLIGALKRCRESGGDLILVIGEARILKVFEITGLTDVFTITQSVDEAISS